MAKMRGLSGSQETFETQIGTNGIAEGLDAIVTVSALHWLEPKTLEHLYRDPPRPRETGRLLSQLGSYASWG